VSNGDVPGSGIPLLGPIISLLSEIFSNAAQVQDLANSVDRVEQAVWTDLIGISGWAYSALGGALDSLGNIIKAIGGALAGIAVAIFRHLKDLIDAIWNWLKNLHNAIKAWILALQKIQKALNAARAQQMRLLIDIVQRIRKILIPFRLLHLGFANKLDSYLVGIESDIGRHFAALTKYTNAIARVLDDLVDPRNLLRPGATLGSLGTMVGAIHGAIGAADVRTLFCLGPYSAASPLVAPWSATRITIFQEWSSGTGDYAAFKAQHDQALQQYATDLGTAPLGSA